MKRSGKWMTMLLAGGLASSAAWAIPLFNITAQSPDFVADKTVPTASAPAGKVADRPTFVGGTSESRKFVVKEEYTDAGTNASFGEGKVLVMSCAGDGTDGPLVVLAGHERDAAKAGVVVVKMDVLIDSQAEAADCFQIQAPMTAKDNRAKLVINAVDGRLNIGMGHNAKSNVQSTIKLERGRIATLEWRFDLNKKKQQLFVDKKDGKGARLGATTTLDPAAVFQVVYILAGSGTRGTLAMQNVQIMPELAPKDDEK